MKPRSEPVDLNSTMSIRLIVRASQKAQAYGVSLLSGDTTPLSTDDAEKITSADPGDHQAVLDFISSVGLVVENENARSRTICVTGKVSQIDAAFGIRMRMKDEGPGEQYLEYDGQIVLPAVLQPIVEAVLGLDSRPIAKSRAGEATMRKTGHRQ